MGGRAQVERHRQPALLLDLGQRREVGAAGPVRLRRRRHVGRRLGQRVLRLRQADHLHRLHRGHRDLQRPRIGVADVLAGGDHDPSRDEGRVLPRRDHARAPVERRIRVVAPHALDEGRCRLVVLVADPVVGQQSLLRGLGDRLAARALPRPRPPRPRPRRCSAPGARRRSTARGAPSSRPRRSASRDRAGRARRRSRARRSRAPHPDPAARAGRRAAVTGGAS